MTIHYLPLEHISMRYTEHLDRAIREELRKQQYPYRIISGGEGLVEIKAGSFLDAPATIAHKAEQLRKLAAFYASGEIETGDIIFTSDLWFPGIESVAYLDYFCNREVRLRGLVHAGSWTDTDHVRRMERWAKYVEEAIFDYADRLFVGSHFHKEQLCERRMVDPEKVVVTGLPLDTEAMDRAPRSAERYGIVFNGRLDEEKQPHLAQELAEELGVPVAMTHAFSPPPTKDEYYALLGRSKIVVSFALQENFGFGLLEGAYMGCVPVVPDRLSYTELFPREYRYRTQKECVALCRAALRGELPPYHPDTFRHSVRKWFE